MNCITNVLLLFIFISCNNKEQVATNNSAQSEFKQEQTNHSVTEQIEIEPQEYKTSDAILINFLDSVGHLASRNWEEDAFFLVDSTLKNQLTLNTTISSENFAALKNAIKEYKINLDLAKRIFPDLDWKDCVVSNDTSTFLHFAYYLFDQNDKAFNEFAIVICYQIYFFKNNSVISKHNVNYHLTDFNYFKDETGATIIYYHVSYARDSGIWWYQYNFYKYKGNQLIPVLTEIENINLQFPWHTRSYWIETKIVNTAPLKIKFIYNNQFFRADSDFINDSTIVSYNFDKKNQIYVPNLKNSKQNKSKLLSYFHTSHDLLFIHSHYHLLKQKLSNNDDEMRQPILNYLNEIRNYLSEEQ